MRPRVWAFALLLFLGSIVGALLWKTHEMRVGRGDEEESETRFRSAVAKRRATAKTDAKSVTRSSPSSNAFPRSNPAITEEGFRTFVEDQNASIEFSAKVIDQYNSPVPGAKLKFLVRQWYVESVEALNAEAKTTPFEGETDERGLFTLNGASGDVLTVEAITKNGYELSPKSMRFLDFKKGANSPPDSPFIFRMWKKLGAEPLVSREALFGIVPDGRVYTLDLVKGTKLEGLAPEGDLRITIIRPTDANPRGPYRWSFLIEAIEGGVLETDDDFMYLAPASGYQPKYGTDVRPEDPDWKPSIRKQFFLRSRQGQVYGRLSAEVDATYNDKSALELNYAINPRGSRNLEP